MMNLINFVAKQRVIRYVPFFIELVEGFEIIFITWIKDPSMKTQSNGNFFPGGFHLTYQIIKLIKVIENIVKIETNINRITCWYDSMVILLVEIISCICEYILT